jgi:prefoldin subunit 5
MNTMLEAGSTKTRQELEEEMRALQQERDRLQAHRDLLASELHKVLQERARLKSLSERTPQGSGYFVRLET